MTDFQIVSDLHIEYKNDLIPDPLTLITPTAEILILAGDIGSLYKYSQLEGFLKRLCVHFKTVFYTPGNHEFYMVPNNNEYTPLPFCILNDRLYLLEKSIPNLFILNQSSVIINNICITGCTLWSKAEVNIPRFIVRIHGMTNQLYENKYTHDLKYIEKMISYCNNNNLQLIVVSHHCPSYNVLRDNHKKQDRYVSLYVSNLDHLLVSSKVNTWIAGHTHRNFDFYTSGGTHLVSNQLGKPRDNVKDYLTNSIVHVKPKLYIQDKPIYDNILIDNNNYVIA